jgi:hypothetical protein
MIAMFAIFQQQQHLCGELSLCAGLIIKKVSVMF